LPEKAPKFYNWAQAVIKTPSVTFIYDEDKVVEATKKRIEKAKNNL
jgi:glutathione S-transferase